MMIETNPVLVASLSQFGIEILCMTFQRPLSISEISERTGISTNSVYRIIKKLVDAKLIKASGDLKSKKRTTLYQSRVRSIVIESDFDGSPKITFNP